jgi:hypothetical protein
MAWNIGSEQLKSPDHPEYTIQTARTSAEESSLGTDRSSISFQEIGVSP